MCSEYSIDAQFDGPYRQVLRMSRDIGFRCRSKASRNHQLFAIYATMSRSVPALLTKKKRAVRFRTARLVFLWDFGPLWRPIPAVPAARRISFGRSQSHSAERSSLRLRFASTLRATSVAHDPCRNRLPVGLRDPRGSFLARREFASKEETNISQPVSSPPAIFQHWPRRSDLGSSLPLPAAARVS